MAATEVGVPLVGRFRLESWLGGNAARFTARAWDTYGRTPAVLKFERHGHLLREYVHLTHLSHPGIARVIEVGDVLTPLMWAPPQLPAPLELTGHSYLATVDVGGRSLHEARLGGEPLGLSALLQLATELAEALAYVHNRQLVHGDVTPRNVVVNAAGQAVLVDFGLALRGGEWAQMQGTAGLAAPDALLG